MICFVDLPGKQGSTGAVGLEISFLPGGLKLHRALEQVKLSSFGGRK